MTHSSQDHINGARAAALKIHKDSRLIHKYSSNNSSSSNSSTISTATTTNQPPRRQPVIIYTHSPEIIHTTPGDFMALVQKLTGKPQSPENTNDGGSSTNAPSPLPLPLPPPANVPRKNKKAKHSAPCDDSSSTSENRGFSRDGNLNCSSLSSSSRGIMSSVGFDAPLPPPPPNSFFADIPLFSHGPRDFYCFPIGCTDSTACLPSFPSENGGSLSPSVIEELKAYDGL